MLNPGVGATYTTASTFFSTHITPKFLRGDTLIADGYDARIIGLNLNRPRGHKLVPGGYIDTT